MDALAVAGAANSKNMAMDQDTTAGQKVLVKLAMDNAKQAFQGADKVAKLGELEKLLETSFGAMVEGAHPIAPDAAKNLRSYAEVLATKCG